MHLTRLVPLVGALLLAPAAGADSVTFHPAIIAAPNGPPRGASMEQVEAQFGAPANRTGPVGDPPITVWHYAGFKVYFEYDRVLHSTARRERPAG